MKRKSRLLILILSVIMILGLLPAIAYAADDNEDGYNDHDFAKMQTFLEQLSDDGVTKNGTRLNPAYNPDNPVTWTDVTWSEVGGEHRIVRIGAGDLFFNIGLKGPLDLSGLEALEYLNCVGNSLGSLDVSGCIALENLDCREAQLTSIDLAGCAALEDLRCNGNQLAGLDVRGATALRILYCINNELTSLDVSANPVLEELICPFNRLTSLDVGANAALQELDFEDNRLTSLDVSSCVNLVYLFCSNNRLATLDVSANTALEEIVCDNNPLTLIKANVYEKSIALKANGNGYVGLFVGEEGNMATSAPHSDASFINWTEDGEEVSTETEYPIAPGEIDYDLAANFSTCTVTFDKNGGDTDASPASMTVNRGGIIELEPLPPTRAGYTFGGWYREQACVNEWDFTSDTVTSNTQLYAKWTRDSSAGGGSGVTYYTVTFDLNGGTHTGGGRLVQRVPYGSAAIAPTATRDGYIFSGWDKELSAVKGNLIVKAQWTKAQSGPIGIPKTGGVSILPIILLAVSVGVIILLERKAKKA
jgi:uncharacterized repeat protein (TIGR02543 family)